MLESGILRLFDFGLARKRPFLLYLTCWLSGSNSVGRMPALTLAAQFVAFSGRHTSPRPTRLALGQAYVDVAQGVGGIRADGRMGLPGGTSSGSSQPRRLRQVPSTVPTAEIEASRLRRNYEAEPGVQQPQGSSNRG